MGGSEPPLLLLHGFPETHLMWHAVAPRLAGRFTVVAADMPGYGDSFRPPASADHAAHSRRALARDLIAAMGRLGTAASPSPAMTAAGGWPTG
jgi:haloacetate dehalogenase